MFFWTKIVATLCPENFVVTTKKKTNAFNSFCILYFISYQVRFIWLTFSNLFYCVTWCKTLYFRHTFLKQFIFITFVHVWYFRQMLGDLLLNSRGCINDVNDNTTSISFFGLCLDFWQSAARFFVLLWLAKHASAVKGLAYK